MKRTNAIAMISALILCFACKNEVGAPKLIDGFIDLSEYNFEVNKVVQLSGEWEFFWKKLPSREEGTIEIKSKSERELIRLPNTWSSIDRPTKGFGTYRARLKLSEKASKLVLKIAEVNFAGEIWVNKKLIYSIGKLLPEGKNDIVKAKPVYVDIPYENHLEILIVVSSFSHRDAGGFSKGISIGDSSKVEQHKSLMIILEASTSFFIMMICIYQIFIFFNDRRRKLFLYFGLFCFTGSIRQLFIGEVLIYNFFQDISFGQIIMFRYYPLYFGTFFILYYYKNLFPKDNLKWFQKLLTILCVTAFIYVTLVDSVFYKTQARHINRVIAWFTLSYILWLSFKATKAKRKLAKVVLINSILAAVFLFNDLLHMENLINSYFLANFGLLSFLLLQAVINHKMYLETEVKVEKLSLRVDTMKEEITKLLSESIQQLKKKKEISHKLNNVYRTTKNSELVGLIAELKSEKLENERKLILKENMKELNINFTTRLARAYPSLTKTDLEICSFIRMGFSSSEIANLRGTAIFSVKSSRYRIRKKLRLTKEIRLTDFLKNY